MQKWKEPKVGDNVFYNDTLRNQKTKSKILNVNLEWSCDLMLLDSGVIIINVPFSSETAHRNWSWS